MTELEPAGEGPLIPETKKYREQEVLDLERLAHVLDGRGPALPPEGSLIPKSVELTRRHAEAVGRIVDRLVTHVRLARGEPLNG